MRGARRTPSPLRLVPQGTSVRDELSGHRGVTFQDLEGATVVQPGPLETLLVAAIHRGALALAAINVAFTSSCASASVTVAAADLRRATVCVHVVVLLHRVIVIVIPLGQVGPGIARRHWPADGGGPSSSARRRAAPHHLESIRIGANRSRSATDLRRALPSSVGLSLRRQAGAWHAERGRFGSSRRQR